MRLIDADELIKEIWKSMENNTHKDCCIKMNHNTEHMHFIAMVSNQMTAFDKEQVLSEMNEELVDSINLCNRDRGTAHDFASLVRKDAWEKAIEIVSKCGMKG